MLETAARVFVSILMLLACITTIVAALAAVKIYTQLFRELFGG